MKSLLASTLVLLALPLCAQTGTTTPPADTAAAPASAPATPPPHPATPSAMMDQVMATLTPGEKTHLMDTRTKTMQNHPELQKEELDLIQKSMSMQGTELTDADKMAFRDEVRTHADKVRAAMIKDDPSVEPIIQKVEAQIQKLRAEYQAAHQ
jgi:hypothetical protein